MVRIIAFVMRNAWRRNGDNECEQKHTRRKPGHASGSREFWTAWALPDRAEALWRGPAIPAHIQHSDHSKRIVPCFPFFFEITLVLQEKKKKNSSLTVSTGILRLINNSSQSLNHSWCRLQKIIYFADRHLWQHSGGRPFRHSHFQGTKNKTSCSIRFLCDEATPW